MEKKLRIGMTHQNIVKNPIKQNYLLSLYLWEENISFPGRTKRKLSYWSDTSLIFLISSHSKQYWIALNEHKRMILTFNFEKILKCQIKRYCFINNLKQKRSLNIFFVGVYSKSQGKLIGHRVTLRRKIEY